MSFVRGVKVILAAGRPRDRDRDGLLRDLLLDGLVDLLEFCVAIGGGFTSADGPAAFDIADAGDESEDAVDNSVCSPAAFDIADAGDKNEDAEENSVGSPAAFDMADAGDRSDNAEDDSGVKIGDVVGPMVDVIASTSAARWRHPEDSHLDLPPPLPERLHSEFGCGWRHHWQTWARPCGQTS